jgi:hypothetical protein
LLARVPSTAEICKLTERRVNETSSKFKDRTTNRKIRAHLGNTQVTGPDEKDTPNQVTKNDRERTSFGQNTTDTNEKTGTDGATDGHELDMSRGETTNGSAIFSVDGVVVDEDSWGSVGDVGSLDGFGLGVLLITHDEVDRYTQPSKMEMRLDTSLDINS